MYRVTFQNSRREEREIGIAHTKEDIHKIIKKFLDEHNFKSYYTRTWQEENRLKYDVGSWTEFFYSEEITIDDIIDDIYANEQQCDFCIFDDECPHGMRCYGGNPIEPPCCNGYDRCFDEDKYWEYKENVYG